MSGVCLPARTHSVLVAPLCGLLHLTIELVSRCAGFVVKCLNSSNQVVKSVARHAFIFRECIHLLVVMLTIVPMFFVSLSL